MAEPVVLINAFEVPAADAAAFIAAWCGDPGLYRPVRTPDTAADDLGRPSPRRPI
jgi:hypothetical protein